MSSTMKHRLATILFLATALTVVYSTPTERAPDLNTSLTAGLGQCPADGEMEELFGLKKSKQCYWAGTAPFCMGKCKPGDILIERSKFGDGWRCWTGTKAYCCPPDHPKLPKTHPDESHTTTSKPSASVTSTGATPSKTTTATSQTSTVSKATATPKPTIRIPPQARPPQVPFPGRKSSKSKTSSRKKFRSPRRKTITRARTPVPPPPKSTSRPSKKGPATKEGGSVGGQGPNGGSPTRGGAPTSPNIPPAWQRTSPAQTQTPPPEASNLESEAEEHESHGFVDVAKDILSGFKDISAFNFMTHFGEFADIDESKDAREEQEEGVKQSAEKEN